MIRGLPLLLAGCWCPPLVGVGSPTEPAPGPTCDQCWLHPYGDAPMDGVQIELGPSDCEDAGEVRRGTALFEDATGGRVTAEPWGTCGRWLPEGGFPPGLWHLVAWRDDGTAPAEWSSNGEFGVGPWGCDPAFTPAAVAHSDWQLDLDAHACPDTDWHVDLTYMLDHLLWLRIDTVSRGRAQVALVATDLSSSPDSACVVTTGEASLTGTGALTWTVPATELPAEVPLPAWDLRLDAAFAADGARAAGEALSLALDMDEAAEFLPEVDSLGELCDLLGAFGTPCGACPQGSSTACISLEYWGGQPWRRDGLLPTTLPACGEMGDTGG